MIQLILIILVVALLIVLLFSDVYRKEIHQYSTPFYLNITNSNTIKQKVILYGFIDYHSSVNYGSDIGISIKSLENVGYINHLYQSLYNPFQVRKLILRGKISELSELVIFMEFKNINGCCFTKPLIVNSYITTEMKHNKDASSVVEVEINYLINIDGNVNLNFDMNPQSSVEFIIYYNTEVFKKSNFFSIIFKKSNSKKVLQ